MVVKWRRQSSLHLHPLSPSLKCRHLLTTLSRWLVNGYTWAICWKIGKLENYIFAKLVPIIVNFFHTLWNLILWLGNIFCGIVVIGIIRHVWGSWKNRMETGISRRQHLSDFTFKRFRCLCVRLRFRYWRCGFSVSWSQGANRLKYSAGQVKPQNKILAFLINWLLNFYWIQYFAAVLNYPCDLAQHIDLGFSQSDFSA